MVKFIKEENILKQNYFFEKKYYN